MSERLLGSSEVCKAVPALLFLVQAESRNQGLIYQVLIFTGTVIFSQINYYKTVMKLNPINGNRQDL